MIKIKNLRAFYGAIEAIKGLDMTVERGKITALIGSNGAGKTTLLKSISGALQHTGSIVFDGKNELIGLNPARIAKLGVIHVPESRHIFPGLTVRENLEIGTFRWHGFFGNDDFSKELKEVYELFPRLEERKDQLGWSLSGGEQQMLAVGRAIMARSKVLLLDEPSMGLAPLITAELFERIREINRRGMTILITEQNARLAMKTSDLTYVMAGGKIIMHGPSEEMRDNPMVVKSYLGNFASKDRMCDK